VAGGGSLPPSAHGGGVRPATPPPEGGSTPSTFIYLFFKKDNFSGSKFLILISNIGRCVPLIRAISSAKFSKFC
jgi:hypothetical protein